MTPQTLFRDVLPGAKVGPYISQFMWQDTPFGTEYVERKQRTLLPGTDHLVDYDNWLAAQNGHFPESASLDPVRRYIRNGRDLSEWVHIDVLFQAYFNALLIMAANGYPPNPGNPYVGNKTQIGFTTFGPPHIATLLCEVSTRALKATWHKKWQVHRRLRPEAYGGLVHNQITADRYPGVLDDRLLNSEAVARVHDKYGTYLLPMVFPEGSPMHPSYTAGHATVAGACVTILKALFDENHEIREPGGADARRPGAGALPRPDAHGARRAQQAGLQRGHRPQHRRRALALGRPGVDAARREGRHQHPARPEGQL